MSRKRYLCGIIIIIMLVGLIGCNKKSEEASEDFLKCYTFCFQGDESVDIEPVMIDRSLPVKDMLQQLADTLSKRQFSGLKIKIVDIKLIEEKQIAIVDLQENENKSLDEVMKAYNENNGEYTSWYRYAQGSTGALCTLKTIEETLLQEYVSGISWIEGIKLLYNGEEEEVFGHIELRGQIREREVK